MGADESIPPPPRTLGSLKDSSFYSPVRSYQAQYNNSNILFESGKKLVKTGFYSKISQYMPAYLSPASRTNQFTVNSDIYNKAIIGYGKGIRDNALEDVWELDLDTYDWCQLKFDGYYNHPRYDVSATIHEDKVFIYGGTNGKEYFDELIVLDLTNTNRYVLETSGEMPPPLAGAILAYYKNKLFLWGGTRGKEISKNMYILDLDQMYWKCKELNCPGRANVPYILKKNKIYTYSGDQEWGLLTIDLDKLVVDQKQTVGARPLTSTTDSSLIMIDNLIFFLGGKGPNDYTLIYVLDTTKNWWFTFYVRPDMETLSYDYGFIRNGIFMIPRSHSLSCSYSKSKKEIIAFLGGPLRDPMPILRMPIAESLSFIHLQEDMLNFFSM